MLRLSEIADNAGYQKKYLSEKDRIKADKSKKNEENISDKSKSIIAS